jgi:hypothetical protein
MVKKIQYTEYEENLREYWDCQIVGQAHTEDNYSKKDDLIREDQDCQGFSCGAAPLGCADHKYCPRCEA